MPKPDKDITGKENQRLLSLKHIRHKNLQQNTSNPYSATYKRDYRTWASENARLV